MKYAIMKYSTFSKVEFDKKNAFLESENIARVLYRTETDIILNLGGTIWYLAKYNFLTKRFFKYDICTRVENVYNSKRAALAALAALPEEYESLG